MTLSEPRVLVNAEPFGFGPAAAVASLTPLLQKSGIQLSYIGEEHTLDLQNDLAYEVIYDITDMTTHQRRILMNEIAGKYDLFITAMDFNMAEIAEKAGIKTIIYDALTWYWPEIHPAIKNAELYIAQQFFGTEERLINEAHSFPAYKLVSPIIAANTKYEEKQHILLNMGGLQNPYWDFKDTIAYAKLMLDAVTAAIPETETLIITTSSTVANALNDSRIVTLPRQSMIETLAKSKFAIMTPGLGNIYDAASFDIPTLWLPPANDSQGQQSKLLLENDCCDVNIDWGELGAFIDYKATQTTVLQEITHALHSVINDEALRHKLSAVTAQKLHNLSAQQNGKTKKLIQSFGANGATDICAAIVEHIGRAAYASAN